MMKSIYRLMLVVLIGVAGTMNSSATTFISEVKIATTTTALTNEGYTAINYDLNKGAGGDYIYLGYKTTTDPNEAITGLAIYDGEKYKDDTYLTTLGIVGSDNKVYHKAAYEGVGSNGDLNAHAGGNWLYLFYSKTGQHDINVQPITKIAINGSGTQVSGVNLNAGTGEETANIWLTIEGTHTHNNSGIRSNGDGTHTFYCTDCGAYIGNASDACTMTITTTDDAHKDYCTVCGYVASEAAHTFENGICTYCNAYEVPTQDAEGYYLLGNAGNALWWNNQKNSNNNQENSARLTADIDLNPGYVFASDGTYTAPEGARELVVWDLPFYFDATLQGDGHSLSGLYYKDTSGTYFAYVGFCAEITNGGIYNLIIRDSYFESSSTVSYLGAFTGYLYNGTIANCAAVNIKGKGSSDKNGAVVGYVYCGALKNCWSYSPNSGLTYAVANIKDKSYTSNCVGLSGSGEMSYATSCDKAEYASGKAAWLANGGSSAGPWKQIIGVDTIPTFNGPSVYAIYDSEGNITDYTNHSNGDIDKNGQTNIVDVANLVSSLDAGSGTYGNADVNGDGSLTVDDATMIGDIILGKDPFVKVSAISITGNQVMDQHTTQTLTTTCLPDDAKFPYVKWSSSDETMATVSGGKVTALKAGTVTITATAVDGSGVTATFDITINRVVDANGHDYVDMGITDDNGKPLYFATMNVGATTPEGYDLYFAWGETTGYSASDNHTFSWNNYSLCNQSCYSLTKYCMSSNYGTVDGLTVLEAADDAAHVNWGGDWRIPTESEIGKLIENCTWTWNSTKNGYDVVATNGNSIFLPAAGCYNQNGYQNGFTYYMCSDLNDDKSNNTMTITSSACRYSMSFRSNGQAVRAVLAY